MPLALAKLWGEEKERRGERERRRKRERKQKGKVEGEKGRGDGVDRSCWFGRKKVVTECQLERGPLLPRNLRLESFVLMS